MSVPDEVPSPKKRQSTKPPATLRAVPSAGFVMEAAIEMQTVIRYLQQAIKRADHRYLPIIPPDQLAELRALAPALRALADAAGPPSIPNAESPTRPADTERRVGWIRSDRKLTPEQVRSIRHAYAAGGVSQKALGREFQVSQSLIWLIMTRRAYTDVPDGPALAP